MNFTQSTFTKINKLKNHSFCGVCRVWADGRIQYGFAVCKQGEKWQVTYNGFSKSQIQFKVRNVLELHGSWTTHSMG